MPPATATPGEVRYRPLRSLGQVLGTFLLATGLLYLILQLTLDRLDESPELRIPRSLGDLKRLGRFLEAYSRLYPISVMIAYGCTFMYVQTFAVPGSLMLSILSGYLFRLPLGLALTVVCTAAGASLQYLLSAHLAGPTVEYYLGGRMAKWNEQLESERGHLFNYLVFLRATPFLPNWFVNLSSPHLRIPLGTFFLGTLVGVTPPTFVHVQAGTMLLELRDLSGLATPMNALAIVTVAVIAIAPIVARKWRGRAGEEEVVVVDTGCDSGGEASEDAREALLGTLTTDQHRREYGAVTEPGRMV